MPEILHDLRSCLRSLRRRPFYALAAVGILALGLAGSMAVVTYVNGFYQPFPGADADRLVQVYGVEEDAPYTGISYPDYLDYAAGAKGAFEGLAALQYLFAGSVRHGSRTDLVYGQGVTGNYFSLLGVDVHLGRGFIPADDRREVPPIVLLSHRYWRRAFAADPAVVGSVVLLNGKPVTVVGVVGPEFLGSVAGVRPDVWMPMEELLVPYRDVAGVVEDRDKPVILTYGRLRPGFGKKEAEAELGVLAAGLDEAYPRPEKTRRLRVVPATWVAPDSRLAELPAARLMLAGGGVLLLVACANVANLLLAVATGRRREMAMRTALGGSPGRLLRLLLSEHLLLATAAGALGLLLAIPVSSRIGSFFARPSVWEFEAPRQATVDLRVVAFALGLAVVAGLVAGVLPALRVSRGNLVVALKAGAESSPDGSRRPWGARDLLVAVQVGLSVVLLVVAGLVLRTLGHVAGLDPGFAVDRLVVSVVSISIKPLATDGRRLFYQQLVDRLDAEPWVRKTTMAQVAPLSGYHRSTPLRLEGQDEPTPLAYSLVVPGYFETLGLEVVRGRSFLDRDTADAPGVALIDETLARRFFAERNPVGRRLWWPGQGEAAAERSFGTDPRSFEIVGVVRSSRSRSILSEPEPLVYFSYFQHGYTPHNALVVRTEIDGEAALPLLERQLREFDPDLVLVNMRPYGELVRGSLFSQRMNAELFSVVALLGLVLAAAGIFSVMSLAVSERTREIGIRMAIGAGRRDVAALVLGRALGVVGLGLGLGLAASFAVTRLVQSLLFGVEATDPIAFAAGTGVLLAAALVAIYLPTRRAAAVDPLTSLRCE